MADDELELFCDERIDPLVVCRCTCGWFDYFRSFSESPSVCPRCSSDLIIRNQGDENEIIYPVATVN